MSSIEERIVGYLPFLRRHARLLTGSKDVGDEYVRLCLELLVAEPARIEGGDLRLKLFQTFHACWQTLNAEQETSVEVISEHERLMEGLARLTPVERRILLLVTVEEFSREEAAEILQTDLPAVNEYLALARDKLKQHIAVPVMIIEDEPLIAMELSQLVKEMGFTVVAAAGRQEQAISAAGDKKPSLILADIQLQDDGSGIVAAQEILQRYEVPIVFVTGFPERLLTGEGTEPAFVVAKPFNEDGLKATIVQALSTYAEPQSATRHRAALLAKLRQITGTTLPTKSKRSGASARA
jgi:DNA-directed RNA polymerase specialized sigma24 family protein/CheY-like chemotaxis protein